MIGLKNAFPINGTENVFPHISHSQFPFAHFLQSWKQLVLLPFSKILYLVRIKIAFGFLLPPLFQSILMLSPSVGNILSPPSYTSTSRHKRMLKWCKAICQLQTTWADDAVLYILECPRQTLQILCPSNVEKILYVGRNVKGSLSILDFDNKGTAECQEKGISAFGCVKSRCENILISDEWEWEWAGSSILSLHSNMIEIPNIYTLIGLVDLFLEEKERGDPAARSLELVVSCHFMKNCVKPEWWDFKSFYFFSSQLVFWLFEVI